MRKLKEYESLVIIAILCATIVGVTVMALNTDLKKEQIRAERCR